MVAFKRILHPFNLLALTYSGLLINNINILETDTLDADLTVKFDRNHKEELVTQHIITVIVVLLLVILDIYLRI